MLTVCVVVCVPVIEAEPELQCVAVTVGVVELLVDGELLEVAELLTEPDCVVERVPHADGDGEDEDESEPHCDGVALVDKVAELVPQIDTDALAVTVDTVVRDAVTDVEGLCDGDCAPLVETDDEAEPDEHEVADGVNERVAEPVELSDAVVVCVVDCEAHDVEDIVCERTPDDECENDALDDTLAEAVALVQTEGVELDESDADGDEKEVAVMTSVELAHDDALNDGVDEAEAHADKDAEIEAVDVLVSVTVPDDGPDGE